MHRITLPAILALLLINQSTFATDWPQWRHDVTRTGSTAETLPGELKAQWTLRLGKAAPAYVHEFRMCADYGYAPVAGGGMLFVPSNVTDQVMALDLSTGALRWRYVTDGPVRNAPIYNDGKVYFASDDGYLYCVDATNGELNWRRRGTPEGIPDMLMLVNGRMVSRWPSRGAPMLHDGLIYFGVGVWPEEGVYYNAVNAATGDIVWQSDALSIVEGGMCDHGSNHDLSLPPQGYPAVIGGKLAVTSGRTLAAFFDLKTGEMDPYTSFYVKKAVPRGSWYVAGNDDVWSQGGNWFASCESAIPPKPEALDDTVSPLAWSRRNPATAEYTMKHRPLLRADMPRPMGGEHTFSEPAFTSDTSYASVFDSEEKYHIRRGETFVEPRVFDKIVARDLTRPQWRRFPATNFSDQTAKGDIALVEYPIKWEMKTSLRALIKAGDQLVAGEENKVALIDIPEPDGSPEVSWEAPIEGNAVNALVADGCLVVVTDTGAIHCFGDRPAAKAGVPFTEKVESSPANGYAFVLGWGDGMKALELASDPGWRVVVFERDAATVAKARKALNALGLYGRRAHVIPAREGVELTPYWGSLVVVNDDALFGDAQETWTVAVDALRPYTGKLPVAPNATGIVKKLIADKSDYNLEDSTLKRISAPDGAGYWTHETANGDNSFVGADKLVKWPLGVLWYSGDIDRLYTPAAHYQHTRQPYPLVKDGKMFIITYEFVHAIDVYTGDYLWESELDATPYVKTRELSNRLYGRPTARSYLASSDLIYCVTGEQIDCLDVETGEQVKSFTVPEQLRQDASKLAGKTMSARIKDTGEALTIQPQPFWTEVRLHDDRLIAMVVARLIAVNRQTGKLIWSRKGKKESSTYTLGDKALYTFDCDPDNLREPRDQHAKSGLLSAIDLATGDELWSREIEYLSWPNVATPSVVPWIKPAMPFLGYNAKHDLLVMASNGNSIQVLKATDGSQLWSVEETSRSEVRRIHTPNILDDYLILNLSKYQGGMGYLVDIRTGEKLQEENQIPKARTCGRLIGNEHMMTYRDAATEIYDIDTNRTIPFNSMRAGCTTSLVPADGVLSAPSLAHGCVCNYPMFASLALYHMPGSEEMRPEAVRRSWVSSK